MLKPRTIATTDDLGSRLAPTVFQIQAHVFIQKDLLALYEAIPVPVLIMTTTNEIIATNRAFIDYFEISEELAVHGNNCQALLASLPPQALIEKPLKLKDVDAELRTITILPDKITTHEHQQQLQFFHHDVCNTLNTVIGLVSIFEPEIEELNMDLFLLRYSAERAVRQLHHFKALGTKKPQEVQKSFSPIDIARPIQQLAKTYQLVWQHKQLQINTHFSEQDILLNTNITILEIILENILKNACESAPKKSTITIQVDHGPATSVITIHNDSVMSADIQAALRKNLRFTSKKENTEHGWGTLSVKWLTENYLRGQVSFLSEQNIGTFVSVAVPHHIHN